MGEFATSIGLNDVTVTTSASITIQIEANNYRNRVAIACIMEYMEEVPC